VIAATNRDLEDAIAKEAFRSDLYHRLRVIPIELPPLRDRVDDIEILGRHFVELFAHRFAVPVKGFTDDAMARMREYDWPGNVRELSHTLETAVLMCDDTVLGPQHLQLPEHKAQGGMKVGIQGSHSIDIDFETGKPTLDEIEYQILEAALEHSGHNLSRAARILGITREAIRYRLEKHRAARDRDQ
jgi:DNA-binding NtrC family response regulator